MPRTFELDDRLVEKAVTATGAPSERVAIEEALQLLIRLKAQGGMLDLFGKVEWDGDLEQSRMSRFEH